MKNTKAILFIVLGAFLLATGFAFAGNDSFDQAGDPALWKSQGRSNIVLPNLTLDIAASTATAPTTPPPAVTPPVVPPVPVVAPVEPVKPPTIGGYISDNKKQIVTAGVVAFIASLVGGPVLLVGLLAFAFFSLNKKF